jgi:hypothetical protein
MDPPENSSFEKMRGTLAMGRDVDTFQSTPRTRTELTDGAWGSVAITGAKGLANGSFGTNPKG